MDQWQMAGAENCVHRSLGVTAPALMDIAQNVSRFQGKPRASPGGCTGQTAGGTDPRCNAGASCVDSGHCRGTLGHPGLGWSDRLEIGVAMHQSMHHNLSATIDIDVDDLPMDVFDIGKSGLTVDSLTAGHGMPENAASACGGFCFCSCARCSS
jgi:hypothetical protein